MNGLQESFDIEQFGLDSKADIKSTVRQYLDSSARTLEPDYSKKITFADLFCGGGGFSLGVREALNRLGYKSRLLLSADLDAAALSYVNRIFRPLISKNCDIEDLVKYSVDLSSSTHGFITSPVITDHQISQLAGKIDLLIGGPPCQGHSNLNNRTRSQDPRNLLYFTMPAFAISLNVPMVIIENVQTITRSAENVLEITKNIFANSGYHVSEEVLCASKYGVAQRRKRHFLIASKLAAIPLKEVKEALESKELSFDDVNKDLPKRENYPRLLEEQAKLSEENIARIKYLHETQAYELDNKMRPVCHQDGHTYPAVYGRIYEDEPMGTITTGFNTPGRGRFIHPHEPRMITIREAARIQSFPDWYFEDAAQAGLFRNDLYKIIGDAVPPLLAYPLIISLKQSLEVRAT